MGISHLDIKRVTEASIAELSSLLTPQILGEWLAFQEKLQAGLKRQSFNAKLKEKWPAKLIANREAIARQEGPLNALLFENELFWEVCKELEEESI
jgi:hypothetical protein